jgi:gas vesicle protein
MAQNINRTGNYFLAGIGIGSLIGVLLAPKSGHDTREYISKKTREGNQFARKKGRELRTRAEQELERGKELIAQTEGRIAAAIDVGVETYYCEKAKAQVG